MTPSCHHLVVVLVFVLVGLHGYHVSAWYDHTLHSPLPIGSSTHGLVNRRALSRHSDAALKPNGTSNSSHPSPHSFHPLQTSSGGLVGCEAGGQYSVEMFISGQGPFRLQLDTGSSTLGVVSTQCDSSCNANQYGVPFNPAINATNTGHTTAVTYGDQASFAGVIYTSPVSLLTAIGTEQTGPNATTNIVAITTQNGGFLENYNCPFDSLSPTDYFQGVVGFGFPQLNTANGDTDWVTGYFAQHPTVSPEFTFQLCPIEDGTLWVGYYDPSATTTNGVFQCAPILSQTYWSTQSCGMSITSIQSGVAVTTAVGSRDSFGTCESNGYNCAVFDSGTTYTYIPQGIYNNFVTALRANPYYQQAFGTSGDPFDPSGSICGASSVPPEQLRYYLPTLNILLGIGDDAAQCGATLSVPMFGIDGYLSRFSVGSIPAFYCATVFPSASPPWTFGDSFLQSYTVRHIVNGSATVPPQICFAGSQGCPDALPPYQPPQSSSSSSSAPSSSIIPSSSITPSSSTVSSSTVSSSSSTALPSSSTVMSSSVSTASSSRSSSSLSSSPVSSSIVSSSTTAPLNVAPSTTAVGAAVSDPRFYGFWGQEFYVSGHTDSVYNLITDESAVVNAHFVYLTNIHCPVINGNVMDHCFNHPGTYFGVLAAHSRNGDQLRITAGPQAEGFHGVTINDKDLPVGDSYGGKTIEVRGGSPTPRDSIYVHRVSERSLVLHVGLYEVLVHNSDGYVDLVSVNVSCWSCLLDDVRPEGLLGRTWNKSVDVADTESLMTLYLEKDNNILGCNFTRDHFCSHNPQIASSL